MPDASRPRRPARSFEPARTINACDVCRDKKVKCSGQQPCSYCAQRNLNCAFTRPEKRRIGYSSQIRALQEQVASFEQQARQQRSQSSSEHNQRPGAQAEPAISDISSGQNVNQARVTAAGTNGSTDAMEGVSPSSSRTTRVAPESCLSSSDTFGSEVRLLLVSGPTNAAPATPSSRAAAIQGWPTQQEANIMLDVVVLNVGISQQLFDARAFADKLSLINAEPTAQTNISELLIVEMCLVFAMGRLLLAKDDENGDLPGSSFFQEAMRRMPTLTELRRHYLLGIEVSALAALYLQVTDQKADAYIYSNMALRLAISHGLHQATNDLSYKSENIHRNRLWWTVYMQERRLCAAGGFPLSIDDHAISSRPPFDAPGYPSTNALSINTRTARVTGQITSTIYSRRDAPESEFIDNVQIILRGLHEIESTISGEYSMYFEPTRLLLAGQPFSETSLAIARTSSSLYLSVYTAIIHAVRPILLYLARHSRDGSGGTPVDQMSPSLVRLAEKCVEASAKTIVILKQLREREILAKHAFLDLDATFSAGFIFVLLEAIHPGKDLSFDGIDGCRDILRYLAGLGNRAAASRLAELDQMCAILRTGEQQPSSGRSPRSANSLFGKLTQPFSFAKYCANTTELQPNYEQQTQHADVNSTSLIEDHARSTFRESSLPELFDADFASLPQGEESALYSAYHPPGLSFTGIEQADWEVLENEIFQGVWTNAT